MGWNAVSTAPCRSAVIAACSIGAIVSTPTYAAVTISSGATQNMTCSGGVCTPTAANAVGTISTTAQIKSLSFKNASFTSSNASVTTGPLITDF